MDCKPQRDKSQLEIIVDAQLELFRLSLYVATQGAADYKGELLTCSLSEEKLKVSQMIALGAGQSVSTILKCVDWKGIPVRDLYPISRSAIESFVNASFVLVEGEHVAERAARWVKFRAWKQFNRNVGSGNFSLNISSSPGEPIPPPEFAEFTEKGKCKEWSELDTPSRIRRVGEIAGSKAGSRLLAAYALNYSISSEIIHGSPFGINYFFQNHLPKNAKVDGFLDATAQQIDDLLLEIAHATAGYLNAFFGSQKMIAPFVAEQLLFNRILQLQGVDPQEIQHQP